MPDYSKSKIYKLTSSNSNEIYIGSTTLNLSKRKAHHIWYYKNHLLNKVKYITSFKIIEYGGNIDICLLEEYSCSNKEQLHQRERFYIENNNCVNKVIPTRTKKEYNELNKELIREKRKEAYKINRYYELNKVKIKEDRKEYYQINKDNIIKARKEYYERNKERIIERVSKNRNLKINKI